MPTARLVRGCGYRLTLMVLLCGIFCVTGGGVWPCYREDGGVGADFAAAGCQVRDCLGVLYRVRRRHRAHEGIA